ncbi:hypothetical protein BLA39750_00133 [Burkholderia lata]|uniref:Uncharacterized protein n=1 Tax=Burkholderia lata (strain ATCC 17760 / DSM 23089 / LMG 22485 / NCIMB 9086 / R18194 / 383) TaxID=482957 RepID=A0A6P2TNP2_BURL3|nr:hypothetical protein [Burkholderia lata]VWC65505.1 hypothetical protein BLA39750_00133 [Burkholderia lata]
MSWTVDGTPVPVAPLGDLTPAEVLYDFDGPQIYIAYDSGRPLFVYVSDICELEECMRLLVVPVSRQIVANLKNGDLTLCDVLRQPWLHAVDQAFDGVIRAAWYIDAGLDAVPDGFKPVEGTLLTAELEAARMNDPVFVVDSPNEALNSPEDQPVIEAEPTHIHSHAGVIFRYSYTIELVDAPNLDHLPDPDERQLNQWVPNDDTTRPPYLH